MIPVLPGWQRPSLAGFVYVTQSAWKKQRVHLFAQWLVEQIRSRMHEMERDFPQYFENHPARRE